MPADLATFPTIFAPVSALGRAGVSVVRVSGPGTSVVFDKITQPLGVPTPRAAVLRSLVDPSSGDLIDKALVLWFPGPSSFTGEDVVELHIHGGRAVMTGLLTALGKLPGYRLAMPGEYSRRAFENGKMDLTEAEAIADLIDAETAAQRRQALRQMDGALGHLYGGWGERLKIALAYIEAAIDFVDEEEIPEDLFAARQKDLEGLLHDIRAHLDDHRRGERLRSGFVIALLGAPNAGKSSLLNALAQREAAIVAPTPGTTRDVIEVGLDLGGYPVTLADTAGLRESADAIESEGIRRALARAESADLKLLVYDGSFWPQKDAATASQKDADAFEIVNKADLIEGAIPAGGPMFVSAQTGEGLENLVKILVQMIADRFDSTAPALTRARHREALEECAGHLTRAIAAPMPELCAEDARLAMRALGRITGSVDVEDLLDIIFSSFCLGK